MYSLILTDIDGTLLQDNLSISQNTISALRKAKNNGLRIVLSSGRYLHGIQFLKDEIGIDDIILSGMNGALIKDGDKYLNSEAIDKESYEIAARFLKGKAQSLIAFSESSYAIDASDRYYEMQNIICRQKGVRMDLSCYDEVSEALGEKVYKLLLKDDSEENTMSLLKELDGILGDRLRIVASSSRIFEILPYGTDKANAVRILEEKLSIPRERMIAFGDWDNDIGMLSSVGMGVAMANGSEGAKKAAKVITRDNNSEGIHYALSEILHVI